MERFKSVFADNQFQREIEDDMNRLVKLVESESSDRDESEVNDPATVGVETGGDQVETPETSGDDNNEQDPG